MSKGLPSVVSQIPPDLRAFIARVREQQLMPVESLAVNSVTSDSLAAGAVTDAKLADASVQTAKLADASVTTAKLADGSVTTAKLADGAVTTAKLADVSVTTAKLADDAVTVAKVGFTLAEIGAAAVAGSASQNFAVAELTGTTLKADSFLLASDTGTNTGMVYVNYDNVLGFKTNGTVCATFGSSGNFVPSVLDTYYCGTAANYWLDVQSNNFTNVSDARVKDSVQDCELGLEFITALRPVSYRFKDTVRRVDTDPQTGKATHVRGPGVRRHYGLIAQEVEAATGRWDFGGHVYDAEADLHALRYNEFIAPLIKAVQELTTRLEALERRANNLRPPGS